MAANPKVLIVGAGPVGLTLANELTRHGVPIRIVDKAPAATDKSKALVLWSRTLELLDRGDMGAAPFIDAGFKVHAVDIVSDDRRVVGHVVSPNQPAEDRQMGTRRSFFAFFAP